MKRTIPIAVAFTWVALLAAISGTTLWNATHGKPSTAASGKDFFRDRVRRDLLGKCTLHDELIHLYGGWARATCRSVCNSVYRHESGMLVNSRLPCTNATDKAQIIKKLLDNLTLAGRKFLYVQFPCKIDRGCQLMPSGYAQDFSHTNADLFQEHLESLHVPYLDVRGMLASTPEAVLQNFFKTDHHWNFDGAFRVFPRIAEALATSCGTNPADIKEFISPDAWERRLLPRNFLGTDGRRTGVLFSGTDKIYYYTPKFKTSISRSMPSKRFARTGTFENSVMNFLHAKKPPSMLLDSGYSIYGSDNDYSRYINPSAPIKKNLLVAKDSYALPIIAWLTTIFERIDVLDSRHFSRMTLEETAYAMESDIVAVMYNPTALSDDKFWELCGDPAPTVCSNASTRPRDASISASNRQYNYTVFEDGLSTGAFYMVSAKSVEFPKNASDKVSMAILDKKTGKAVKRTTVPSLSPEWVVDIPDNDHGHALLLYSGESIREKRESAPESVPSGMTSNCAASDDNCRHGITYSMYAIQRHERTSNG